MKIKSVSYGRNGKTAVITFLFEGKSYTRNLKRGLDNYWWGWNTSHTHLVKYSL